MGVVSLPGDVGPCAAYVLLELDGGSGDGGGAGFEGAIEGEVLIDGGGGGGGSGEGGGLFVDDVDVDGVAERSSVVTIVIVEDGGVGAFTSCAPTCCE